MITHNTNCISSCKVPGPSMQGVSWGLLSRGGPNLGSREPSQSRHPPAERPWHVGTYRQNPGILKGIPLDYQRPGRHAALVAVKAPAYKAPPQTETQKRP